MLHRKGTHRSTYTDIAIHVVTIWYSLWNIEHCKRGAIHVVRCVAAKHTNSIKPLYPFHIQTYSTDKYYKQEAHGP